MFADLGRFSGTCFDIISYFSNQVSIITIVVFAIPSMQYLFGSYRVSTLIFHDFARFWDLFLSSKRLPATMGRAGGLGKGRVGVFYHCVKHALRPEASAD